MNIELRPVGMRDVPALVRLYAEAERVDDTGEHFSAEDLTEELSDPALDLSRDVFGAFDGDDLVGFCSVLARGAKSPRKAQVFGLTRPDRRGEGVGTALADAMLTRLHEVRRAAPGPLLALTAGVAGDQAQRDLLARVGLEPSRWSFAMRVHLDRTPVAFDDVEVPEGYLIQRYDDDWSDRLFAAHNIAFLDHPNFSPWTRSEWQQWVVGSRSFRPEMTFLATPIGSLGTVAAYLQTAEFDAHEQATGRREAYVGKLGTLPDHRRRGLAGALLRYALAAYTDHGYAEAALDVDAENPTGALRVYERAGFAVERTFANYSRLLD